MGIMSRRLVIVFSLMTLAAGCVQGHCRRKQEAPTPIPTGEAPPEPAAKPSADTNGRVQVFKYDGSLQCGAGKAIAPETMAKDLGGIKVFSMIKKADGLMHIQVCGSNTGMANVFEISEKDLKKAEAKGFKKWSFE